MTHIRFDSDGPARYVGSLVKTGFLSGDAFNAQRAAFRSAGASWVNGGWRGPREDLPDVIAAVSRAGFDVKVSGELADDAKPRQTAALADIEMPAGAYAHQHEGVQWLTMRRGRGALLADDMGLGKTMQVLTSLRDPFNRAVVVCPAIAKGVWMREVAKWRPDLTVTVLSGRGSFRWPEDHEVVVVNYDILPKAEESSGRDGRKYWNLPAELVASVPSHVLVLSDEAQYLKAWKAQRTKNFRALAHVAKRAKGDVVAMTGTPMMNHPGELWSVLQAASLATEAFGSYESFQKMFHAVHDSYGGVTYGHPDAEVPQRLARVMLRRTKEQVLDLPPKLHEMLTVDCDAAGVRALTSITAHLNGADLDRLDENEVFERMRSIPFEVMARARAAVALGKLPAALEIAEECEEEGVGCLVFSAHVAPVKALAAARPGWGLITGETSSDERFRIAEAFQRGELYGIAATIDAAGTALTLTRATREVFLDQDWTPAANAQAEDRAYRIGQKQTLLVTVLVADHPVDRRVNELLVEKRAIISAAVDAVSTVERVDTGSTAEEGRGGTVEIEAPPAFESEPTDDYSDIPF